MTQFRVWFDEALAAGLPEPTAMTLATATTDGVPSARTVLLKGVDARGFVFFTNYTSRKGQELAANPRAALVFYWAPLAHQVCVRGTVTRLTAEESDAYFATRGRGSQLGAWASPQSAVVASREDLDRRLADVVGRFPGDVPRPPHWGGFRVSPETVEFWEARVDRLHDRLRYRWSNEGWVIERLAP